MYKDYLDDKIKLEKYQKLSIIFLIVVASGIFGWLYEFIFYYFNGGMKTFYMQGGNFLPWINIYAIGAVIIFFLTKKYKKKPIIVFLIALIASGLLEYFSGLIIYKVMDGLRLWDYNKEILNFGNIGGFVCLRSVLFFGISGLILVYLMVPMFVYISKKMPKKYLLILSITLFSIVIFDEIYNLIIARALNLPRASTVYKDLGFKYVNFK